MDKLWHLIKLRIHPFKVFACQFQSKTVFIKKSPKFVHFIFTFSCSLIYKIVINLEVDFIKQSFRLYLTFCAKWTNTIKTSMNRSLTSSFIQNRAENYLPTVFIYNLTLIMPQPKSHPYLKYLSIQHPLQFASGLFIYFSIFSTFPREIVLINQSINFSFTISNINLQYVLENINTNNINLNIFFLIFICLFW